MRSIGHILVIDDDPRLRQIVAEFLRDEGFEVDTAGTAAEGIDSIQQNRPALVLLHVHLPDLSGHELPLELRRRDISPPIVVMTAAHDARNWARERGSPCYI